MSFIKDKYPICCMIVLCLKVLRGRSQAMGTASPTLVTSQLYESEHFKGAELIKVNAMSEGLMVK